MDTTLYDRRSLAQALHINLDNSSELETLDTLVHALLHDEKSELLWWMLVRNSDARRYLQERHTTRVQVDNLTGALNGIGFEAWLRKRFLNETRSTSTLTIIMIDLVNFKRINDTLCYRIGDEVIKEAVAQLSNILRRDDDAVVVRFSGDELAIAIADISEVASKCIVERIHNLQIEKLKYQRSHAIWRRVIRAKKLAHMHSEFMVREVDDASFGDMLRKVKRMVFIDEKPVIELVDLLVIASGMCRGIVASKQDCTKLLARAEKEMKLLKLQYHKLMGGAYR